MLPVAHLSEYCVVYHSTGNLVVVYAATDMVRKNRKKVSTGYNSAGYTIDADICPYQQLLTSGASSGLLGILD
jgi:hypothetical protein